MLAGFRRGFYYSDPFEALVKFHNALNELRSSNRLHPPAAAAADEVYRKSEGIVTVATLFDAVQARRADGASTAPSPC